MISDNSKGFTLIELLVVIILSLTFLLTIYQLTFTIFSLSTEGSNQIRASNLAYKNLRMYATGGPPLWYACSTQGDGPYLPFYSEATISGLPTPVKQTVEASAPYGCSDGSPIKVVSTVTYGPKHRSISHATYAYY